MRNSTEKTQWKITYADEGDIPCWMALVHLVIDGFPHLYEEEYVGELKRRIRKRQALILKDGEVAVGAMLFSGETGSIDFMGTHPLYRSHCLLYTSFKAGSKIKNTDFNSGRVRSGEILNR